MVDLKILMEKFPAWDVESKGPQEFDLFPKDKKNRSKVVEIIEFLEPLVFHDNWSLNMDENGVKIFKKAPKKYHKMYTSGCFDIFHYGHLNILKKSKELCDYLIVGVSTDELIAREKGRKPVIPFQERMRVVQAIGLVDEVIPQEDKNKQKIVETYKIDAISVGDDWRGRYPKVSCTMEYFPYTANVSSTILKDALKLTEKKP